jgi:glycosyltransferase involved in cell wall biosynthesis
MKYDYDIPTLRYTGINWLPLLPHGKAYLSLRRGLQLYKEYVSNFGIPDIIHAHSAIYAGALAAIIKARYSVPFVITEHSSAIALGRLKDWQRYYLRKAYKTADLKIAVSPQLGRRLQYLYGEWNRDWQFLPNIIDLDFVKKSTKEAKTGCNETFVYLTIGNLFKIKRHDFLLRAFAKLFDRDKRIFLHIGGEGPQKKHLIQLSEKLRISQNVLFLGGLSRDEVFTAMQNCNVFVSSSKFETFGVALIEALVCGKPVIAINRGGPKYIVNSCNGMLVEPDNIESLTHALSEIKLNYSRYDRDFLRSDCIGRFGEDKIVSNLLHYYKKIVK